MDAHQHAAEIYVRFYFMANRPSAEKSTCVNPTFDIVFFALKFSESFEESVHISVFFFAEATCSLGKCPKFQLLAMYVSCCTPTRQFQRPSIGCLKLWLLANLTAFVQTHITLQLLSFLLSLFLFFLLLIIFTGSIDQATLTVCTRRVIAPPFASPAAQQCVASRCDRTDLGIQWQAVAAVFFFSVRVGGLLTPLPPFLLFF